MILGRSPALWASFVAAALNVAVVVFGVPITTEGVAALNGLAVVLVGLLANRSDAAALPLLAPTGHERRNGGGLIGADHPLRRADDPPPITPKDGLTP